MISSKFNDLVSRVISYVGYFLLTAFMTIFSILAVLALALVFIEKDIFNLVGVVGCAFVVWVMWLIRKALMP